MKQLAIRLLAASSITVWVGFALDDIGFAYVAAAYAIGSVACWLFAAMTQIERPVYYTDD